MTSGQTSMLHPIEAVTPAKVPGLEVAGVWPCWIAGTTGQMSLGSLLLLLLIRNASKRRGSKLTSYESKYISQTKYLELENHCKLSS